MFVGIGMLVPFRLKSKFKQFGAVPLASHLSGKEVAERMLHENGIYDVRVVSGEGFLSDHYNPISKTVSLSPELYHHPSIAAARVASHECGHAVQHVRAYPWLMFRSRMVPIVQVSAMLIQLGLLAEIPLINVFPGFFSLESFFLHSQQYFL
jgi:Zn-dependent membrane protease YugP